MALALLVGPHLEHRKSQQARRQHVRRDREIAVGEFLGDYRAGRRQARVAVAAEALGYRPLHQPELPSLGDQRGGNLAALVGGRAAGRICSRANAPTVSRIICCSSLNSKLSMVDSKRLHWDCANPAY